MKKIATALFASVATLWAVAQPGMPTAPATPASTPSNASAPAAGTGLGARLKSFFGGAKLDRAKLAALGTSALLSYGAPLAEPVLDSVTLETVSPLTRPVVVKPVGVTFWP